MSRHVQVILKEEVDNLGSVGEVVRVRPGYARNFLLPRGMAVMATRGGVKQVEHERRLALKKAEKLREEAQGRATALTGVTVRVEKNAGEEGKLYGSVTAAEIAERLHEAGYEVDRRKIQMPAEPIKSVGTYELEVKVQAGVVATFKVEVVAAKE